MKKKIKYIIFAVALTIPSLVSAAGFDVGTTKVCGMNVPKTVPKFTSTLFTLFEVLVPVILIILGMIDMLSAMSASNSDQSKKASNKFITRIMAAVIVFLVLFIVRFAFNAVSTDDKTSFSNCVDCLISNQHCNSSTVTKADTTTKIKSCESYKKTDCPSKDGYKMACTVRNNACVTDCTKLDPNTCRNLPKKCSFTGTCKFLD